MAKLSTVVCDMCQREGTSTPATDSVTIRFTSGDRLTIDVCERHCKEIRKMAAAPAGELVCPECGERFVRAQGLGAHLSRIHGKSARQRALLYARDGGG